jgi:hypothetical protein
MDRDGREILLGVLHRMKATKIAYWSAQSLWIATCIVVLVVYLHTHATATDADTFLGYAMIALSFPLSLADVPIHGFIEVATGSQTGTVWAWCEMFILGYVQWFVLLPLAVKALRQRASSGAKRAPGDR